jgi:hypothetical protein
MLRMFRTLRRLLRLGILIAGAYTAYTRWANRRTSTRPALQPTPLSWPASSPNDAELPGATSSDFVQVATDHIAPAPVDPPIGHDAARDRSDVEDGSAN